MRLSGASLTAGGGIHFHEHQRQFLRHRVLLFLVLQLRLVMRFGKQGERNEQRHKRWVNTSSASRWTESDINNAHASGFDGRPQREVFWSGNGHTFRACTMPWERATLSLIGDDSLVVGLRLWR